MWIQEGILGRKCRQQEKKANLVGRSEGGLFASGRQGDSAGARSSTGGRKGVQHSGGAGPHRSQASGRGGPAGRLAELVAGAAGELLVRPPEKEQGRRCARCRVGAERKDAPTAVTAPEEDFPGAPGAPAGTQGWTHGIRVLQTSTPSPSSGRKDNAKQ